jgi:hypothetical protein
MATSNWPMRSIRHISGNYYNKNSVFHPRALLIDSNVKKLDQLNFNKPFDFKTMGLHVAGLKLEEKKKKKTTDVKKK